MTAIKSTVRSSARWYNPISIWRSLVLRPKVQLALATAATAYVLLPSALSSDIREAAAWCAGGGIYLALSFRLMSTCKADRIRDRAAAQDDGALVILGLILLAILSSFFAIFGVLAHAKAAANGLKLGYIALAAATLFISWMVMQVVFAVHYAHEHYAPDAHGDVAGDDDGRGLSFPNDDSPDYWDFLYFATSIGATSQTSDVSINSKSVRRLVTVQAIVAFFFNTMVVALAINLAAGLTD